MRYFLRHLPLFALAGCATTPRALVASGIGCERAEHGVQARAIAIYTRVVADRVCMLDAAGRCHVRVDSSAVKVEIQLPRTPNAPTVAALRQELGRRGILARIARPRGPKMYASNGLAPHDGLLVVELSDIGYSAAGDVAHVMVRTSGAMDSRHWRGGSEGDVVRLERSLDVGDEGLSRRMTSPARACWRMKQSASTALGD